MNGVNLMHKHLESTPLSSPKKPRYAFLLQTFLLLKLGQKFFDKSLALVQWLESELQSLGLDISEPRGGGMEAVVCRDLPSLSRVSMTEVDTARAKRKQAANLKSEPAKPNLPGARCDLLEACTKNPLSFDPLQANSGSFASEKQFRGGLPLSASALGLAKTFSSKVLHTEMQAMGAFSPQETDTSAVGWFLTGGACQWTSGGLQVVEARPTFPRSLFARRRQGVGMVCGLGPCVLHFPDLAPGGVTIAVTLNDVLHGRVACAQIVSEVLAHYGAAPSWTHTPVRVISEVRDLVKAAGIAPQVAMLMKEMRGEAPRCGACHCTSFICGCGK